MSQNPAAGVQTAWQRCSIALQPSLRGPLYTFIPPQDPACIQVGDVVQVTGTLGSLQDGERRFFKTVLITPILGGPKEEMPGFKAVERLVSSTGGSPYAISATYVSLMGGECCLY